MGLEKRDMFTETQDLKTILTGGTVYTFAFETEFDPGWSLKTNLQGRIPDPALEDLKAELRGGTAYLFDFETAFASDALLKTSLAGGIAYAFSFETELAPDWDLKCDLRAKSPLKLNFSTLFTPSNRRMGEEYLELYPVGETTAEILTIPINWYQKGQTRTWSLDLWYARRQEADRADDVRLSVYTFGADNRLGQEVVQNGYLKAKLSTSLNFEPLSPGTFLSLGPMWPNTKKTLDFQFNMPVGTATPVGLTMIGLRIELLRSVVYGSAPFGRTIFGEYKGKRKDVLIKLHVMQ